MYLVFNKNPNDQVVKLHRTSGEMYDVLFKAQQTVRIEALTDRDIRHLRAIKMDVVTEAQKSSLGAQAKSAASSIVNKVKAAVAKPSVAKPEEKAASEFVSASETPAAQFQIDEESDINPEPVGTGGGSAGLRKRN